MNNEEFRKLIKSSAGTSQKEEKGKSTKEIVREVVEQEFRERRRRNKKRGRDEDYFSDDDDDDNEDDDRRTRDQKEQTSKGNKSNNDETAAFKVKKDQTKKPKYRDRAKERREGKNQYSNMAVSHLDEEMTKYLGGDEEYTHLVRGLDIALAEKVKRDEQLKSSRITKQDDNAIDLDKVIEETVSTNRQRTSCTVGSGSLEVHKLTNLSSGMISYLNNRLESIKDKSQSRHHEGKKTRQAAQLLVRTTLNFSLDANIYQRYKSWEIPKENTLPASEYERSFQSPHCTPVDSKLLERIKVVYSRHASNDKKAEKVKAESKCSNDVSDKFDPESDDDIFGNIGEYVPPSKASS
jgi:IK cytokine